MRKTLAILGTGVVVGAVAYAVWHKMNKVNPKSENNPKHKMDDTDSTKSAPAATNSVSAEEDVDVVKNAVAQNVAIRHEEAAQIMKDAVDVICKRSEVSDDEMKELEQISDELDDLLREE